MNATELKKRAIALAEKTKIDSVTPEEVGKLSNDIVEYIENVELNGSTLGIRKTYTSVSAMEADSTAPKDDKGVLLRRGMLVNIYNQSDPDSADNGKVFSFQNPGWAFRGTVDAGYATKEELTELDKKFNELNISSLYPTNGEEGTNKYTLAGAIAQVPAEYRSIIGLNIKFINNDTSKTEEWTWNGGTFTNLADWKKYYTALDYVENKFEGYIGASYTYQLGFLNSSGGISTTGNYYCKVTNFLPCKEGDKFYYRGKGTSKDKICVFFSDGKPVSSLNGDYVDEPTEIVIPSGINSVKFASNMPSTEDGEDTVIFECYNINANLPKKIEKINLEIEGYQKSIEEINTKITPIAEYDNMLVGKALQAGGMVDFGSGTVYQYNLDKYNNPKFAIISASVSADNRWALFYTVDIEGNPIKIYKISELGKSIEDYYIELTEEVKSIWTWTLGAEDKQVVKIDSDANINLNTDNKLNQWKDKKIVWIGTSIPYGQGIGGQNKSYPNLIGGKLDAIVYNHCQPGMAIETTDDFKVKGAGGSLSLSISELEALGEPTTNYKSYENAMLGMDADLYVFDTEPNNSNADREILDNFNFWNFEYTDGSTFEEHRNCYAGAFLFLLKKLWEEKPTAKVVMIGENGLTQNSVNQMLPIRTVSIELSEKLRIHYINIWNKLYYNKYNKDLYLPDYVHPSALGHERIANMLANELLLIG